MHFLINLAYLPCFIVCICLLEQLNYIPYDSTENQEIIMAAPKEDIFVPFPVKEQLPFVDFCLTSNPPIRMLILSTSFVFL